MESGAARVPEVLIAGGGIAGVEAALSAADRLAGAARTTVISQEPELTLPAFAVTQPFDPEPAERHELEPLLATAGVGFIHAAVARVLPLSREVELGSGRRVGYDRLIVCVGARGVHAFGAARTFWSGAVELGIDALIRRALSSEAGALGLVVPPGENWSLPIYELALMTRRRARLASPDSDLTIRIYTPELAALSIFGPGTRASVADLLSASRIEVVGGVSVRQGSGGRPMAGSRRLGEGALISLPRLVGPRMPGLPSDDGGFILVDQRTCVSGVEAVMAAGDGTATTVRQGGLAAQAADAAAARVAFELTGGEPPAPPTRVLRARLFSGDESLFLMRDLGDPADRGRASADPLWWPPSKVAAPRLSEMLTNLGWRDRIAEAEPRGPGAAQLGREWHATPLGSEPEQTPNGSVAST